MIPAAMLSLVYGSMSGQADFSGAQPPLSSQDSLSKAVAGTAAPRNVLGEPVYWWVLTFIFSLFVLAGLYSRGIDLLLSGRNDFAPVYAATTTVGTSDMYNPDKIHGVIYEQLGGGNASFLYTRMPFHAAFLWPLSRLSYRAAYAVYLALQTAAVIVFMVLWRIPTRTFAVIFTLLSLPVIFSLLTGQDTVFLLVWIALAVRAESRGESFWSGVFLSLCAHKFHLFMFVPLLVIGQRRWRILAGGLSGGLVLLAISFLAAGMRWPLDYYATLTNPVINPAPHLMVNLHGLFYGIAGGKVIELACGLLIAGVIWFAVKRTSFLEGLAVVIIGGLLTSYHTYTGDCVLLVPACSIVVSSMADRWTVPLVALALLPVFYVILVGSAWSYGVQAVLILLFCSVAAHVFRRVPETAALATE